MKNPKSSLLRVSDFCRRPNHQSRVAVKLAMLLQGRTDDSICLVGVDTLASLAIHEKSLAFLCHGAKRVLVRLILKNEDEDDDEEIATAAPITFANLGLVSHEKDIIADCWLEESKHKPSVAHFVRMRPLCGQCTTWPHFYGKHQKADDESSWALPASNTLIQESNLLSVYDSKTEVVSHYEILEIRGNDTNNATSLSVCLTSNSTKFELDGSSLPSIVRRLPSHLFQQSFYQGEPPRIPPHPNLLDMIQALCQSPNLDSSEKVIHVVGSDTAHCTGLLIETAAKQLGMQCLSIRGLAAFGHHQGATIRTGSLVEQLAGLRAAFQLIRTQRMEPCVLHLQDMDLELSSSDEPLRHEQEEQFWAQWIQALKTAATTTDSCLHHSQDSRLYTPPVFIVISTSSALNPGPLMEKLVFPSILLDTPDMKLAKYLWGESFWDDAFWDSHLLKGRNAQDLRCLCQQLSQYTAMSTKSSVVNQLGMLCEALDTKKRKQSSKSAQVSNVQWDDVGGLSHVRKEILDAIELPLKYPHLFPSSKGRSSILLYGPPGTGKTLVAKAVATECGLPFYSVKGPELLGSYVGESEASVRGIFSAAREAASQNTPIAASILFFDELDSLAPRRGGVGDGGGVMERVVATLFAELDGPEDLSPDMGRVFVMGATNRPDLLDPSLLRPGRLDRLVYLGVAVGNDERARVLAAQIRKLKLTGDPLDMAKGVVSSLPPRLTGADLSAIASGALSHAVQRLCQKADDELRKANESKECSVTIEQILEGWDIDQRTPTVQLEDLLEASRDIVPSLSQTELERYERLREQYTCMGSVATPAG